MTFTFHVLVYLIVSIRSPSILSRWRILCQENGIVFQSGAANKKVIIFNKKPLLL